MVFIFSLYENRVREKSGQRTIKIRIFIASYYVRLFRDNTFKATAVQCKIFEYKSPPTTSV